WGGGVGGGVCLGVGGCTKAGVWVCVGVGEPSPRVGSGHNALAICCALSPRSVCVCVCVCVSEMAPVSMQAPVCLIDNGTDGRMSVQQGALQILEQIQEPVV